MKLLTIIGARPQIIKAAAFSRAVAAWNNNHNATEQVQETILHTGQHYDDNMSAVFFRELGIPEPHINLHVGSGTHGTQTARMIEGIEDVLTRDHFDGVVLYGDTNSTLAGAVAASKIHVPVFHIEAGLRSWNMAMPEEINRIVCDQLSSILFTPTTTGLNNLLNTGFVTKGIQATGDAECKMQNAECRVQDTGDRIQGTGDRVHFRNGKGQYVVQSGDVMYDNSMFFADMAEEKSDIIERLNLTPKQFVLATIHRPANTDSAANLTSIFTALLDIAEGKETENAECRIQDTDDREQDTGYRRQGTGMKVVLPLHPRTRKLLPEKLPEELLNRIKACPNILMTEPASFFEIIRLERHARLVMTDSGGVQKEAFFFSIPCVILRPETEWVEIIDAGAGILADADYQRIIAAFNSLTGREVHFPPLFGDAHAAEHILSEIVTYLQ